VWARSAESEATGQRIAAEAAKQEALAQADEAQRQRAQANAHLYRSLVGEARAIREARGSGYRVEAWKRLEQALRLETPEKDAAELRREAGACLGDFVGLEPTDWEFPAGTRIMACDLHPSGELLAILLVRRTTSEVLVRNLVTGQEVARLQPERGMFISVTFSADGKKLFAGASNGVVKVWQVAPGGNWLSAKALSLAPQPSRFVTPSPFFPFFVVRWQFPPVSHLAVSPRGSQLAACSRYTSAISVWNLEDGSLAPEFSAADAMSPGASMLTALAFSSRGDLMAAGLAGSNFDGVLVWDVATREVRHTLRPGFGAVDLICFSADGKYLACCCDDGVALFDTVDFQRRLFVRGHSPVVAAFSPDSRLLAIPDHTASVVRLWDITTNREVAVPVRRDMGQYFVGFAPDGRRMVAAGRDWVRIWDLAGAAEKRTLSGHGGGVSGLAFSPDGKLLASTCKDRTVRLWDPVTGRSVRVLNGFSEPTESVAFSADGRFLVTTEYVGGGVKVWEVQSGQEVTTVPHDLGPAGFGRAAFSPDSRHFVACGNRGVRIWRVVDLGPGEDSRPRLSFKETARPTPASTNSACFSPDGKLLAWAGAWVGSSAHQISVWDLATGQERSWPACVYPYSALSFLPDSKQLALVDWNDGKIEIRNAADGQVTATFGKKELIQGESISTALSPDGAWLAVGGDRAVTVWDLNKRELLFALPEERGTIWSLAWSPDKSLLAVGSSHGGPTIWTLPRIRAELSRIGLGW
jgi:WD40 repeat protein